ncbi:MAG TPA: hypothetical protein VK604_24105 [Bryobacteraceae bacterium]|nr:hypothetical protein [Bryobacteraceae bacterium]
MQDKPLDFSDIRPEIMAFALLMEKELRLRDYRNSWKNDQALDLARHVKDEANDLLAVVGFCLRPPVTTPIAPDVRKRVVEEAADVANMAMMVADVTGCLDAGVREFASHRAELARKDMQRGQLPLVENSTPKSRVRGYSEAFHAGFEAGYRGWTVDNPYVSSLHRKVWEEGAMAGRRIVAKDEEISKKADESDYGG